AKYRNYKFYSLSELNQKLEDETKILNAKHSKNLNGSRIERFLSIDADAMKILPAEPYALDDWQYEVKVPKDYHICVGTNYYSVPFQYVGQHVDIQIGINTISIFHERTPIASYKKSEKTQDIISTTAHMPATHEYQQELDPDRLLAWGKKIGKSTHEVVRKNIKERKDVNNGFICVKYLKKWLIDHDDRELLEKACEYALKINSCTKQTMISLLKNKPFLNLANKEKTTKNKDKKSHENIRGSDYYKEVHKNDN
ncbi:MAG: hypothetical protein JJV99_13745, partial [Colwellia sp.]|nr:hypothetical protein [Colwellia sp.]